jgi:hypothetical protein
VAAVSGRAAAIAPIANRPVCAPDAAGRSPQVLSAREAPAIMMIGIRHRRHRIMRAGSRAIGDRRNASGGRIAAERRSFSLAGARSVYELRIMH